MSKYSQGTNEYHALLIGIGEYETYPDLGDLPINNVQCLRDSLVKYEEWNTSNIHILTDTDATESNIHLTIQNIGSDLDGNSTFLFYFSGHGGDGYIPDDDKHHWFLTTYKTYKDDKWNEWHHVITEDELNTWIEELPTDKVIVLLTSCVSGGVVDDITTGVGISSCAWNELTYGHPGWDNHDPFTFAVLEALSYEYILSSAFNDKNLIASVEEIYTRLQWRVPSLCTGMHPQIKDNYSGSLKMLTVARFPYKLMVKEISPVLWKTNFKMTFSEAPLSDLPAGKYYCDIYKVDATINFSPPYKEPPRGAFSPIGYSAQNPNDAIPWEKIVCTTSSGNLKTFFYHLKKDPSGESMSRWAPVNPFTVGLKYGILGQHIINPPYVLQAEVVGEGVEKIKLSWLDHSDNELGFIIYRSTNGIDFPEHKRNPSPNPEGSSYTVVYEDEDNIQIGQNYWYKIKAYAGEYTSEFSNIVGPVKVPWLNAPTNLTADAISYDKIVLR
jgi:hypothetical protein